MRTCWQIEQMVLCDARLETEELEPVIAPLAGVNHNETFLSARAELTAEELEPVTAPLAGNNHNESFLFRAEE